MRYIRKGREPKIWRETRLSTPGVGFDNLAKAALRDSLLLEQGHLCCYCMGRIYPDTTRIEHRLPRHHQKDALRYTNVLAACPGNEGHPPKLQHCDVRKGDREITLDPTDPRIEKLITYSASGSITSPDSHVRQDLGEGEGAEGALNLNLESLRAERRAVLAGFVEQFSKRHGGKRSADILARELPKWASVPAGGGKLPPYCGVVADFIRKRIERARGAKPRS